MKIKTLIGVQQTGAQRFINLLGSPEKVQQDVNNLFNYGIIQEIPEHYREGADGEITVVTSEYRLKKVAYATALSDAALKGWKAGKAGQTVKEKTEIILKKLKEYFAAEKCPFTSGEVKILAVGGHGRAGTWDE